VNTKEKPIVVLGEPIAPEPCAWLAQRAQLIDAAADERSKLLSKLNKAHGLIVRTYTSVDRQLLDHAPDLRVIARAGVGLDNIDLDACRERGIRVVHTPSANTNAVVEYVTQLMLSTLRPITRISSPPSAHEWHTIRDDAITDRSCVGATLGIVGFGKIGSSLARVGAALSMRVIYCDLNEIPRDQRSGASPFMLDELARASDVVSVHVDGRADNKHLIDAQFFDLLKGNAIFINSSRGFVVNPQAASSFAIANPQSSLILDVHDPEPIAPDSPLLTLDNVTITPHIGAGTRNAKEAMSWVVRDLVAVLAGDQPEHAAV